MRSLRQGIQRINQSRSMRGAALSLLIQLQSVFLQLITGIILAREFGPAELGVYSFAYAVVTVLQIMPNSGLDNAVVRYSSEYRAQGQWALLGGLWRMALVISVTYGLITAGIVLGAVTLHWFPPIAALSPPVLAAAALPMVFLPLMTFLGAALRSISPGIIGQLPQLVVRPWLFLAGLGVLIFLVPVILTPELALYVQGAVTAIAVIIGGYWLWLRRPVLLSHSKPAYEFGRWWRSVLPFSMMGGLMLINSQTDLLMLGILTSAHDTGLYRVATSGANLVALSLTAANLYIAPRISALYSQGELHDLQYILRLSVRSSFAFSVLFAVFLWLTGRTLIGMVFGAAYVAAYVPLSILCLGQLINVGSGSVGLVLNMTGHERGAVKFAGIAAILNIILNALLIPWFSDIGAAIATMISMACWNILMALAVKRRIGVNASLVGF
ncbi:flippase [Acidihalobacter prosperus]